MIVIIITTTIIILLLVLNDLFLFFLDPTKDSFGNIYVFYFQLS